MSDSMIPDKSGDDGATLGGLISDTQWLATQDADTRHRVR
jgi:hypothetical protein